MGLLDLVTNTVTGMAEVAVNTVKVPIGVVTAPFEEDDKTLREASEGISKGLSKIGKSD